MNFAVGFVADLMSSDGGIIGVQIWIREKTLNVYLNKQKAGKGEYLLQKITSIGGQVFANSEKNRRDIITNLWPELLKQCSDTVIVPANRGWIREGEKQYRFVEKEAVLWDEILKRAK